MAAAGIIAEFLAKVGFQTDEKSLDGALGKVKGFGLAIGAVALGATAAILKIANRYDDLGRASERLGTTIDEMQRLQYVAEQTGAPADAVRKSLEGLRGANPYIKDTAAALEKAGQRMQGMSRAAREAYAARMGIDPALIPMLTKDTSALSAEFAKMQSLAGINAQAAAEASRGLLAELGKAKSLVTLLADSIGTALIGRLRGDVERFRRGVIDNFGAIKRVLTGVVDLAMRITGTVVAYIGRILSWGLKLVAWFDSLSDAQQRAALAVGALLAAWRLFNLGLLATPIGMVLAALAGLVALVDDFLTYMEGGESLLDWGPWEATILDVVRALKPLVALIGDLAGAIVSAAGPALETLLTLVGGISRALLHVADLIRAVFTGDMAGAVAALTALLDNAAATIRAAFGGVFDWISGQLGGLTSWMPDWAKKGLGLGAGDAISGPALTPGPSAAAALAAPAGGSTAIDQKTEINVYSSADPQAVGQAVARGQDDVNARLVRNAKGAVR